MCPTLVSSDMDPNFHSRRTCRRKCYHFPARRCFPNWWIFHTTTENKCWWKLQSLSMTELSVRSQKLINIKWLTMEWNKASMDTHTVTFGWTSIEYTCRTVGRKLESNAQSIDEATSFDYQLSSLTSCSDRLTLNKQSGLWLWMLKYRQCRGDRQVFYNLYFGTWCHFNGPLNDDIHPINCGHCNKRILHTISWEWGFTKVGSCMGILRELFVPRRHLLCC